MKRRTVLLGTAAALVGPAIAAEVPKHITLPKTTGFEAQ